jgi:hypothetical protein
MAVPETRLLAIQHSSTGSSEDRGIIASRVRRMLVQPAYITSARRLCVVDRSSIVEIALRHLWPSECLLLNHWPASMSRTTNTGHGVVSTTRSLVLPKNRSTTLIPATHLQDREMHHHAPSRVSRDAWKPDKLRTLCCSEVARNLGESRRGF